MSAVFTAACTCGLTATAPGPTLGAEDRGTAFAAVAAAGLRWVDGVGHRCPDRPVCSPVADAAVPEPAPQADLFAAGPAA